MEPTTKRRRRWATRIVFVLFGVPAAAALAGAMIMWATGGANGVVLALPLFIMAAILALPVAIAAVAEKL